jgi:enhancing lycopene biosynthesis protein 2
MSNDSAALLELEKRRLKAMNDADPAGLLELLGDDHVHVLANGLVTDKAGRRRA